jgi:nucleoside-diphosphate-sugar epimerase
VTNAEAIGHLAQCAGASAPARFSGKGRPGDPPVLRADVEGTRGWGWSPTVAWRDGFRDYVRWFRDEGRA